MYALFPVNPTLGGRPFWIEGGNAGLKCCPEWPLSQGVPRLSANGSWMDGFNLMIIRDYKPFSVKNWHDNGHSKKVLSLFFYFNLFRWRFQFLEFTPNEKRMIRRRERSLVTTKVYVLDQWVSASGNMAHLWGEKHWCIVLCQSQWNLIFFWKADKRLRATINMQCRPLLSSKSREEKHIWFFPMAIAFFSPSNNNDFAKSTKQLIRQSERMGFRLAPPRKQNRWMDGQRFASFQESRQYFPLSSVAKHLARRGCVSCQWTVTVRLHRQHGQNRRDRGFHRTSSNKQHMAQHLPLQERGVEGRRAEARQRGWKTKHLDLNIKRWNSLMRNLQEWRPPFLYS